MTGVGQRSAQDVGAQLLVEVRLFHEMLLKGGNRPLFVRRLRENLRTALQGLPVGRALNRPMMALLPLEDPACWPELRDRLEHLLGVERFGRVWRVAPDMQAIRDLLDRLLEDRAATSFRISARRSDKSFPLNSPQINRELGAYVQGARASPWTWSTRTSTYGSTSPPRRGWSAWRSTGALGACPWAWAAGWRPSSPAASIRPWPPTR